MYNHSVAISKIWNHCIVNKFIFSLCDSSSIVWNHIIVSVLPLRQYKHCLKICVRVLVLSGTVLTIVFLLRDCSGVVVGSL